MKLLNSYYSEIQSLKIEILNPKYLISILKYKAVA